MRVLSGGQSRNFSYPKWGSAALEVLLCSGIISLDYRQAEKVSLLLGKIVRKPGFYAENNGDLELLAGVLRNAKDIPALQVLQLIDEKLEDSNSIDHAETLRRLEKMAADFKGSAGA